MEKQNDIAGTAFAKLPKYYALTPFERAFVDAYVSDPRRNITRAYMAANSNVKYDSARTEGPKLLAKPCIQEAVTELEERVASLKFNLPRVVARFQQIAFQDQYVSAANPDEPPLPGMEECFPVLVKHSDSIAAAKLLLQVGGLKLPESLELSGSLEVKNQHELSPAALELMDALQDIRNNKNSCQAGENSDDFDEVGAK